MKNGQKPVLLDSETHRQLDIIKAEQAQKRFNETMEFLIRFYREHSKYKVDTNEA